MTFPMNRRRFVQATSSAFAVGALSSMGGSAEAQSSRELRVLVGGGALGKAAIEAYVKPFQAETGIVVNPVTDQTATMTIQLMVTNKNYSLDVVPLTCGTAFTFAAKGLLEPIDFSIYKKENLDGYPDFTKKPFGAPAYFFCWIMAYSSEKFPAGKGPSSWADFWDVRKFPAVRSLVTGQYGSEGPWEEALLADGVSKDALYPLDIDRIFASLDKIKPHIRKWWTSGSEIYQLMHDKAVELTNTYDGRLNLLLDEGAPLTINRNQAKLAWQYWTIPKGCPNAANAQKFIEFTSRADRQAAFAQLIPYGPSNLNAFKLLPDSLARRLASHPDNLKVGIPISPEWYAAVGSDGMSNTERLIKRWNQWILG